MYRALSAYFLTCLLLGAETDYRFAFPQSELLMGIDVKWLMKNPLIKKAKAEAGQALGELQLLEAVLDQVDGVYVSVVSKAGGKGVKAAGRQSNSDIMILVKGNFDVVKLGELGARNGLLVEQWGKTKVLLQPAAKAGSRKARLEKTQFNGLPMDVGQARPVFALYDNKNILVGEAGPLRVALERFESGLTPQANPLFERARDLEAANDFWIVGSTAPLNLASASGNAPAAANDPFMKMASQVRNFSLGMALRRSLNLDLQFQTISPKAATQMLEMAKGALALMKMSQKPEEALPVDLDKALQLSANGNMVRASLSLEQQEMDQILAQMKPGSLLNRPGTPEKTATPLPASPGKPTVTLAQAPAAAPIAAPVAVPQRKTVLIYGMPGGPKEVPVQ